MEVIIKEYNPRWAAEFIRLKACLRRKLNMPDLDIQHVGSTSVEGLAAKEYLDIDIVVDDKPASRQLVVGFKKIGYLHQGERGIKGRESMGQIQPDVPYDKPLQANFPHALYVCVAGCDSLQNHLLFRDYLRGNPEVRDAYGMLKKRLALVHRHILMHM